MKLTHQTSLAVLTTILLCSGFASAAVISINSGANGAIGLADSAGAVSVANWNDVFGVNASANDLLDSLGATTTLDVAFTGGGNTFNNNGIDNPNQRLLSGFLDGTATAVISQIPYLTYDVYVYYNGFAGTNTQSWTATDVDSASTLFSYRGTQNSFDVYNSGSAHVSSSYATSGEALNNPGTYVLFSGMNGATLTIARSSGSNEIGISGIQIVDTTIIPEPSTVLAFGLGAGIFALRRRRA